MIQYRQLVRELASRLPYEEDEIRLVLQTLVEFIYEKAVAGEEVLVQNLGALRLKRCRKTVIPNNYTGQLLRFGNGFKVTFTLARRFTRLRFGEEKMEKYGVEMEHKKTASGQDLTTCPWCGELLVDGFICPVHGSEPFESNAKEED